MAAREGAAETLRGVEGQLAIATKGHASAIEVSRRQAAYSSGDRPSTADLTLSPSSGDLRLPRMQAADSSARI